VKFAKSGCQEYRYKGVTFKGRVVVVATRDIEENEELVVDYGLGYCKKWNIITEETFETTTKKTN